MKTVLTSAVIALASIGSAHADENPCSEFGGKVLILTKKDNSQSDTFCQLADPYRSIAALETFQNVAGGQKTLATDAFLKYAPYQRPAGPTGHPAFNYCGQMGGKRYVYYVTTDDGRRGGEFGICSFEADGSMIDEWTLFRHDKDLKNFLESH